ncbi:sodium/calcium exchanger 3 isoform X4 [Strix aluco]|uniref:sodium/calcium exchanger 3 isoform X4 n=1 Tax=Strix aluco TaxID=111821 RepID=UPI003DA438DF
MRCRSRLPLTISKVLFLLVLPPHSPRQPPLPLTPSRSPRSSCDGCPCPTGRPRKGKGACAAATAAAAAAASPLASRPTVHGCLSCCPYRKTVRVKIVDEEEYERQENFFIALGEPKWMERGISALLLTQEVAERKLTVEEEEAKRIAEMGKPILGEHPKLEVIIEESYEFKSTVDKLIKKTNLALVVGTHSWRDQFMEAITVSAAGDEDEDESGEERLPSCFDYVMHFLTVFWKVLFACVPPTEYCNGWACFVVSILIIGMLTAVIGDLASHFGCTIGLKDSVTAVVFVAFGTSVPDTFASKAAAIQDVYADASISNVTGSNAVNVFLGIGLAWSVAAIYWASQGQEFQVSAGTLAFSVTLFTIFAFICISVLLYRRRPHLGGELGGPRGCKLATTLLFVSLWLLYILFATLEAYCYIKGF